MSNKIVICGLGGPDKMYRVLDYFCVFDTTDEVYDEVSRISILMKIRNRNIREVYAIDSRRIMKKEYTELFEQSPSNEWVLFRNILQRESLRIS